tara:strand:+ start:12732 stop:13454 length:723 start_codon:yes stop_codon:yes gene_type:complete
LIIPKKSLGQNFLIDKNICKKISKIKNLYNQTIIEIGPGYGNLTDYIIKQKPKKIILIEKDNELNLYLKKKYFNNKRVIIYSQDALRFNYTNFSNYIVISNLPYNISTKLILKLFNYNNFITTIIVMLQKEVAEKFNYKKNKMNKYKFLTNFFTDYKILFHVSPKVFFPKPKVSSSVVIFKMKKVKVRNNLNKFINEIFKNKRKKIINNFKNHNNINNNILNKRVEELNFEELIKLYKFF